MRVPSATVSLPVLIAPSVLPADFARLGEEVAAAIVLHEGKTASERELQDFANRKLAAFKVPKRIVLRDRIPVNRAGKTDYAALSDLLAGSSE